MSGEQGGVRVSQDGARLNVTIDRPQARNALSIATLKQITAVFSDFAGKDDVKVAVLSGAGDKAFAAGGDLKELAERRSEPDAAQLFDIGSRATEAIRLFPVPVIAALNGVALGGGAELAVSCDFRLAAWHAAIGFVQSRLGLTTGFGGVASLQQLLGARRAMRLMLDATVLPASEAERIGLVDVVASEGETLDDLVARFIEPIVALPRMLVREIKAVALAGMDDDHRKVVGAAEKRGFVRVWTSPEHWEASDRLLAQRRERR